MNYDITKEPVRYQSLGFGDLITTNTVKAMIDTIKVSSKNLRVIKKAADIVKNVEPKNQVGEVTTIYDWVRDNTRYIKDPNGTEMLQSPLVALDQIEAGQTFSGDCFSGETEVLVLNNKSKQYELKTLASLEESYKGYKAISYNFDNGKYELKKITGFVHKRDKQTYAVKLRTGRTMTCTDTHSFYLWSGRTKKTKRVSEVLLRSIDLTKPGFREILASIKIPDAGTVSMVDAELYLYGIYAAEGYAHESHVAIAQNKPEIVRKIRKALSEIGISYREARTEQASGGYFDIHKGEYKDRLREMGTNSFNMKFPDWVYSLTVDQIEKLLEGYADGDAFIPKGELREKRKWNRIYNTSSDVLAKQLVILHNIIGKPLTVQYQVNHMGVGKRPIWRLYDYIASEKSNNTRRHVIPDTGAITVLNIQKDQIQDVYCLQVEDNHNFVLANGVLTHNCDCLITLLLSLLKSIGYPVALRIASYKTPKIFTHVYGLVRVYDKWTPIEAIRLGVPLGWEAPGAVDIRDYEVR